MRAQRLAGALSVTAGLIALTWLTALFFVPIPNAHATLVDLGMPGVLLSALAAILAVCLGAPFVFAGKAERFQRG